MSSSAAVETRYVHIGPTRIRVRVTGDGPPLLMIMGIGGNLDMWAPLASKLGDRQLITFDFPGTGGSGLSWLPPTMPGNALMVRLLLRKLGYRKVDVLGYSWGGVVAQHLAIQHPRVVGRLVLAATTVGWGGRVPHIRVASKMLTPRRYYSSAYFKRVAPTIYGGRFRSSPEILDAEVKRRVGRPPSLIGYSAQLAAVWTYTSLPGLPFVTAPTLVLAGDDDPLIHTSNARLMSAVLRNATMRILPGAGHLFLVDSVDLVAPMIEDFLGDPDSALDGGDPATSGAP